MYFGSSALIDFALCTGLGVATACCVVATMMAANVLASAQTREGLKNLLRFAVFLLGGAAQLSIAAFIGGTKSMRDADSILGFAVGVLAVVLLGVLIRKLAK